MSLIRNLIKEPENKTQKPKKKNKDGKDEKPPKPRPIVKSFTDLQRLKLEKLMKNPDKPIVIPEPRKEKDYLVPSFVRNVMGSSAGAGSGEFHVYRHLRRKEYARQKTIQAKSVKEQLDDQYQNKLEDNLRASEEKTAKKRAKRLKKKQRAKRPRQQQQQTTAAEDAVETSDSETSDKDEEEEAADPDEAVIQAENVADGSEQNAAKLAEECEEARNLDQKEEETTTTAASEAPAAQNVEEPTESAQSAMESSETHEAVKETQVE